MRSLRLIASVPILAAALLLGAAGPASAGTWVEAPCSPLTPWPEVDGGLPYWQLTNNCPDALTLESIFPSEPGLNYGHYERRMSGLIESVKFKIWGSDGVAQGRRQGLVVCASVCDYTNLVTVNGAAEEPQEVTLSPGAGIPAGAFRVVIAGDCIGPLACPIAPPIHFSDIEVERRDDFPPTLDVTDDQGWVSGDLTIRFIAKEDESYLDNKSMRITGPGFDDVEIFSCGRDGEDICGNDQDDGFTMPAAGVPNGVYTITYTASDIAGNAATASRVFKVDTSAPSAPDGITVQPGREGWIGRLSARVNWVNDFADQAGETESGIAGARYRITSLDAESTVRDGAVSELDVDSLGIRFPWSGDWSLELWTVDAAGNESAASAPVAVSVDASTPPPPKIAQIPAVNRSSLGLGRSFTWNQTFHGASGICGAAVAIDDRPGSNPGDDPDAANVDGPAGVLTLSAQAVAALPEGDTWLHVRSFSCAGTPGEAGHAQMLVDFANPEVHVSPNDGWIASDQDFQLVASDSGSGVDSISYSVDATAPQIVHASNVSLDLAAGSHSVEIKARDLAGNWSDPVTYTLGSDAVAPQAVFTEIDPADPAAISAVLSDQESGLDSAQIEHRPPGGAWRRLGEALRDLGGAQNATLTARLPGDGELEPGRHELRVLVTDRVGNTTTTSLRPDGSDASFVAPLREATQLTLKLSGTGSGTRWLRTLTVGHGASAYVRGRLSNARGEALAGRTIELTQMPENGVESTISRVTTSPTGEFQARLPGGPNRTIGARFGGDPAMRPASIEANLLSRGAVTLKTRRRVVGSGRVAELRGRVADVGLFPRDAGKRVVIEWKAGGRFGAARRDLSAADDGRFVFRFRYVNRGRRAIRFSLRARVPAEAFWPFELSLSKPVTIVVKP